MPPDLPQPPQPPHLHTIPPPPSTPFFCKLSHLDSIFFVVVVVLFPLWNHLNGFPDSPVTLRVKYPVTGFLTSHSSFSKTVRALYHTVPRWHHMECGCRLEKESSGTHLSCWAQMHCSPHTVWLIATVHSHTRMHECTCADKRFYTFLLPHGHSSPSLSLSLSHLLPLPFSWWGQWRAQTPVRADNCSPDDATERRQEAIVKRTTPSSVCCSISPTNTGAEMQKPLYENKWEENNMLVNLCTDVWLGGKLPASSTHSHKSFFSDRCIWGNS